MPPVVPQLSSVTSESLQAQVRSLLPSQDGFGADLAASNVIQPVIDLTSAAEGSTVRSDLQTAFAFGSITAFNVNNGTVVIANTPGFYRVLFNYTAEGASSSISATIELSDGVSTKELWKSTLVGATGLDVAVSETLDFVVFLAAGESISAISSSTRVFIRGSSRQIANVNGELVNPSGFSPQ